MLNDMNYSPWGLGNNTKIYSHCSMQHSATTAHAIKQEEIKGSIDQMKEINYSHLHVLHDLKNMCENLRNLQPLRTKSEFNEVAGDKIHI